MVRSTSSRAVLRQTASSESPVPPALMRAKTAWRKSRSGGISLMAGGKREERVSESKNKSKEGRASRRNESKQRRRPARAKKPTSHTRQTRTTHGEANSIVRRRSHAHGRARHDVNWNKSVQTLLDKRGRNGEGAHVTRTEPHRVRHFQAPYRAEDRTAST